MAAKKSQAAVIFVSGSDEAGVKKAAAAHAAALAPGADAFGLETIDGAVENVDGAISKINDARQAVLTLPFLGGSKLVWLKNASFLADSIVGRSESVQAALESLCGTLAEGLPAGVTFLMSAPEADKRRSAYKTLSKLGTSETHDRPTLGFGAGEEEIISWTATQARVKGVLLSEDGLAALAARVGLDTRQLDNELEKLLTAFGNGHKLSADDVRTLVPGTRESGIFDIGNAIAARNLPLALDTLGHLFYQGERGVGILLASIVPTIRNMLLVKDLMATHKLAAPGQAHFFKSSLERLKPAYTDHLPRKKDGTLNAYSLGLAAQSCSHYTLPELRRGFIACGEANRQLVTSQNAEDVVLARLLTGIMARA